MDERTFTFAETSPVGLGSEARLLVVMVSVAGRGLVRW